MRKNLVFGFLLNKTGLKLVFESNKLVLSRNGDFVGKGFCHGGLFVLDADCENMKQVKYFFCLFALDADCENMKLV